MSPAATGAVSGVLSALEGGAATVHEAAHRAGVSRELAELAIDTLIRMGRIDATTLATGCPIGGCRTCASGVADQPGCGASAPSAARQGPVLVALRLRPPD